MAIFGILKTEPTVQTNDKTRLDARKSFVSKDELAVTLIEIEPDTGAGFVDITGSSSDQWFLDWSYATDGDKTVSLRITTDGAPVTETFTLPVVTPANDKLFTTDDDIRAYENEIMDLIPYGRSSFNYMHRKVRDLIIDWFNEEGYRNFDGTKITVDQILDNDEVRRWSENWVLHHIYQDNSNSIADKFTEKAAYYASRAADARNRSIFELDLNKDGNITRGENINVQSVRMKRS